MNKRLHKFIKFRCGRQSIFADEMGWDRQYVSKLCRGISLGITPIVAILEKFPELDARWLLLGVGDMIRPVVVYRPALDAARDQFVRTLELGQFLPVMSDIELEQFAAGRVLFPPSARARWEAMARSPDGGEILETSCSQAAQKK